MSIQNYIVVKPSGGKPLIEPAVNEGAHYYAFSRILDQDVYPEAYAKITLPTDIVWTGSGQTRNAYISLGIASLGVGHACDMGLCNWGGSGWSLCFGGVSSGNTVIRNDHNIPDATKSLVLIAKNDKSKDTDAKSCMTLYAHFFGECGDDLGDDSFSTMVPKCHWDRYYRFASLLHMGNNSFLDGTKMLGTAFNDLMVYNKAAGKYESWGVTSQNLENAWIVGYPSGVLYPYDDTREVFNIENLDKQPPGQPTTPVKPERPARPVRPQRPVRPERPKFPRPQKPTGHGSGGFWDRLISRRDKKKGGSYD